MEQQQFQIYDDVQGFRPMEVSSYIPTLDRNQRIAAQAEQEKLAQIRANNQVRQKNAELAGKDLMALGELSKTLADVLIERQKGINEEEEAEGYNQAYLETLNGNGPDLTDLDAGLEQAKGQATTAADVGSAVLGDNGENYEAAQRITKPTTWKAVGALKGRLSALSTMYPSALEEYVTQNNPSSSEERAALVNNFRRNFFKGVSGVSAKYLSKDFYPSIAQAEARLATRWRKQFAIEDSETVRAEATAAFNNDFDIPTFINSIRNTVDGSGKPLGYSGAWNEFTTAVTEARKAGLISELDIQSMKDQVIPEGAPGAGKKYGEFYKSRFGQIERNLRAQRNRDYQLGEQEKSREIKEYENNLISSLLDPNDPDGFNDDQLEDFQKAYMRMSGGQRSQKLDNLARLSVDAKTREDQEELIKKMISLGILTPQELAKFDPKLQQRYMSTAQQQGKNLSENNNFKTQTEAIKDAVEYVANVSPLTRKHPSVGLKVAQLQEQFRKKYQAKVLGGMDAATAAQTAMSEVVTEFQQNPDWDPQKGFSGLFGTATPQAEAVAEDQALAITETLREQGAAGLDKTDTFFDEATLEDMSEGFGKPGYTFDPRLLYIANKLGISPLDVLRRQRKAYGMVEIPPTPAEEIIQNELTPEQRTLLNTTPTVERSQRGMTGVQQFNAALLPSKAQPYAQQIDIAASAYNIPPAILAGLLETESSWNPSAISRVGAKGLAQFMPATAAEMGVTNPNDPMQAINGAAKYLRHLMDNYGFDLNTAIKAYNGGPGGIDKSQENREYLPKVLRNAGKYGYGAQTLREPSVMRDSSPVLAYISGNIGPTSTGPHLDVKEVGGGNFEETALDEFVEVDDPEFGRVSLGEIRKRTGGLGDNQAQHRARGSHGIDYGLHSGTKVYVKNGAKVVSNRPSAHGDVTTIELPNGKQYTFIHGKQA